MERCEKILRRWKVLERGGKILKRRILLTNGEGKFSSVAKRRRAKWENNGVAWSATERGGKILERCDAPRKLT